MKYAQWQVLHIGLLDDIADPDTLKTIMAKEHLARAERAYGAITGIDQTFYTRVGSPIDDGHIPAMALRYSEPGDVVLVTITAHCEEVIGG